MPGKGPLKRPPRTEAEKITRCKKLKSQVMVKNCIACTKKTNECSLPNVGSRGGYGINMFYA